MLLVTKREEQDVIHGGWIGHNLKVRGLRLNSSIADLIFLLKIGSDDPLTNNETCNITPIVLNMEENIMGDSEKSGQVKDKHKLASKGEDGQKINKKRMGGKRSLSKDVKCSHSKLSKEHAVDVMCFRRSGKDGSVGSSDNFEIASGCKDSMDSVIGRRQSGLGNRGSELTESSSTVTEACTNSFGSTSLSIISETSSLTLSSSSPTSEEIQKSSSTSSRMGFK
ncbi:hypothetical protein QYF36_006704 [Acer negundo]|nr:hypothetical protein QYF36_006704 [Acer negundo]